MTSTRVGTQPRSRPRATQTWIRTTAYVFSVCFLLLSTHTYFFFSFQDEDWQEEDGGDSVTNMKTGDLGLLSEMLGLSFDHDDVLQNLQDPDLMNDPVCQMDMQVRCVSPPQPFSMLQFL